MTSPRYDRPPLGRGPTIAVAAIATTGGVLAVLGYHTNPGLPTLAWTDAAAPAAPQAPAAAPGTSPAAAPGTAPGTAPSKPTESSGRTVKGQLTNTRWGIVQVEITMRDGRLIAADAPKTPDDSKVSVRINKHAVPILNQQAVRSGGARIDGVSGATVTSDGYRKSLQSALDLASRK